MADLMPYRGGVRLVLALQVGMRYLLDMSFFWIEELCRFLLIYLTFLGSTLAWGRRKPTSASIF